MLIQPPKQGPTAGADDSHDDGALDTGRHGLAYTASSRATLWSALVLLVLVFALSPAIILLLRTVPVEVRAKELVSTTVVGLIYCGVLLAYRRVGPGTVAALFVLVSVRINHPLGGPADSVGSVGPHLWIVHVPLLATVLYTNVHGGGRLTRSHALYAGFAGWSLLAAVLGAGPRPDVALQFSSFVLQAGLVFALATWAVTSEVVEFETGVAVVVLTTLAHGAIALLQLLTGGPLGFPQHGEAQGQPVGTLGLGPLGELPIGPHVGGFAYGGPFSVLVTLAVPMALGLALRYRGRRRAGYLGATLVLCLLQRTTAFDAGRGAVIVGLGTFGLLAVWRRRVVGLSVAGLRARLESTSSVAATTLACFGVAMLPGSQSGGRSARPGAVDGGGVEVDTIAVPFFDLSNLGVRLQQYVVALDLSGRFPLFGLGGGNFYYVSAAAGLPQRYWLHSAYLQVLVGVGIPGFLLYCGTLGSVLVAGLRSIRTATAPLVSVGVVAGLVGVLVQVLFTPEMNRLPSTFTFWLVSGLLVGRYVQTRGDPA